MSVRVFIKISRALLDFVQMSGNYITRTFAFSDMFVNCGSIQTSRKLLFEY